MILYINKAQWTDNEHSGINAKILTDTYNMLCDYHFIPEDPEFQEIVNSGFNIETVLINNEIGINSINPIKPNIISISLFTNK